MNRPALQPSISSSDAAPLSSPLMGRGTQRPHSEDKPSQGAKLRSLVEIEERFRCTFSFTHFNAVQSACFDSVYYGRKNFVVAAPTGSGKTVIFELAILNELNLHGAKDLKMVYLAPTKALCSEKANIWKEKFESLLSGMSS